MLGVQGGDPCVPVQADSSPPRASFGTTAELPDPMAALRVLCEQLSIGQ